MTTYAERIEALADGEPIEAAVVGCADDYFGDHVTEPRPWLEMGAVLDVPFEEFSSEIIVVAWTPSWIIFTRDYDSMCSLRRWPRHPRSFLPRFNGLD